MKEKRQKTLHEMCSVSVCQRRRQFQGARTARFCIQAGNSQKIWEKQGVPQLHTASFFKFIAANFSLTQVVTRARPRCCVYRIACFSFASANTRSIVSFLLAYICLPRSVFRNASASSRCSCHICLVSSFCPFSFAPHASRQGQFLHMPGVLRYVRFPSVK